MMFKAKETRLMSALLSVFGIIGAVSIGAIERIVCRSTKMITTSSANIGRRSTRRIGTNHGSATNTHSVYNRLWDNSRSVLLGRSGYCSIKSSFNFGW